MVFYCDLDQTGAKHCDKQCSFCFLKQTLGVPDISEERRRLLDHENDEIDPLS